MGIGLFCIFRFQWHFQKPSLFSLSSSKWTHHVALEEGFSRGGWRGRRGFLLPLNDLLSSVAHNA